jgi:hypothetical protein
VKTLNLSKLPTLLLLGDLVGIFDQKLRTSGHSAMICLEWPCISNLNRIWRLVAAALVLVGFSLG